MKNNIYSVWLDGQEVNDYYLTLEKALIMAHSYLLDEYETITIRKEGQK